MKLCDSAFEIEKNELYFDAVISLGGTCQTAYQLNRMELRQESLPFDWLFSCLDHNKFIDSIRNDFSDWLNYDNLIVDENSATEHLKVTDSKYNMIHQHIFPLDIPVSESYPDVIKHVNKRIARLLKYKNKQLDLLFIRTNMSVNEAEELRNILISKYGKNSVLVVLNHTKNFTIKRIPVSSDNLYIFEIYDENEHTGQNWRGYDKHWDYIFRNVKLKNKLLNIKNDAYFINTFSWEINTKTSQLFRWCSKNSAINLIDFGGCMVSFILDSSKPIDVELQDANGNTFHKCKVFNPTPIEFMITHEKRIVTINALKTWKPSEVFNSSDDRELSVFIQDIKITQPNSKSSVLANKGSRIFQTLFQRSN